MKRLAIHTAVVFATVTGAAIVWEFHAAFLLLVLSLATAAAVRPSIERMVERRIPRSLAITAAYLVGFVVLTVLLVVIGNALSEELRRGTDALSAAYDHAYKAWPAEQGWKASVAKRLPPSQDLYRALAPQPVTLAQGALSAVYGVIDVVGQALVVIVLSLYWNANRESFERLLLSLLPGERRGRARDVWRGIETGVGDYIRSEVGQSVLAILVLSLGFRLMQLDYPTLPAVVGALARLIPLIGGVLAVVAAALAGWASSPTLAVLAGAYAFAVLIALTVVVAPRTFQARRYNPILVVFTVVALSQEYGLAGLVAAPPLAAAIQIFFERVRGSHPAPAPRADVSELEARLSAVEARVAAGEPSPELASVIGRLRRLLADATS